MIIFSHILGDYYFQTQRMAILKGEDSIDGYAHCLIHSIIYSMCIFLPITMFYTSYFTSVIFGLWLFFGIFFSHFYIDKYSLGAKFIKYIKGGPDINHPFYPSIYIIIDNSAHLFLMWMILRFMGFPI